MLIQDQKASQHVVAYLIRPPVPEALFLTGGLLVVLIFVELGKEFADGLQVGPAISIEYGSIRGIVQAAKFEDVARHLARIMESVASLRETFVVPDHERGPEVIVRLA